MKESSYPLSAAQIQAHLKAAIEPQEDFPSWLFKLPFTLEETQAVFTTGKPWKNLLTSTKDILAAAREGVLFRFQGGQMADRQPNGEVCVNADGLAVSRWLNTNGKKFYNALFSSEPDFKLSRIADRVAILFLLDISEIDPDTSCAITLMELLADQGRSRRNVHYDSCRVVRATEAQRIQDVIFAPKNAEKHKRKIVKESERVANLLRSEIIYELTAAQWIKDGTSGNVTIAKSEAELKKAFKQNPQQYIYTIRPDEIEIYNLLEAFSHAMDGDEVVVNFPENTIWDGAYPTMAFTQKVDEMNDETLVTHLHTFISEGTDARQLVLNKLSADEDTAITYNDADTCKAAEEFEEKLRIEQKSLHE